MATTENNKMVATTLSGLFFDFFAKLGCIGPLDDLSVITARRVVISTTICPSSCHCNFPSLSFVICGNAVNGSAWYPNWTGCKRKSQSCAFTSFGVTPIAVRCPVIQFSSTTRLGTVAKLPGSISGIGQSHVIQSGESLSLSSNQGGLNLSLRLFKTVTFIVPCLISLDEMFFNTNSALIFVVPGTTGTITNPFTSSSSIATLLSLDEKSNRGSVSISGKPLDSERAKPSSKLGRLGEGSADLPHSNQQRSEQKSNAKAIIESPHLFAGLGSVPVLISSASSAFPQQNSAPNAKHIAKGIAL